MNAGQSHASTSELRSPPSQESVLMRLIEECIHCFCTRARDPKSIATLAEVSTGSDISSIYDHRRADQSTIAGPTGAIAIGGSDTVVTWPHSTIHTANHTLELTDDVVRFVGFPAEERPGLVRREATTPPVHAPSHNEDELALSGSRDSIRAQPSSCTTSTPVRR